MSHAYNISVVKADGLKPLGRPWRRFEDNIKMDRGGVDWIHLAQDRDRWRVLVNTVMTLLVP
jgi:hypothetical protein